MRMRTEVARKTVFARFASKLQSSLGKSIATACAFVLISACSPGDKGPMPPSTGAAPTVRPQMPAEWPNTYGLGQPASAASIALLDTDIDTTGAGLPDGHGTAAEGAIVFAAKCASCHGAKGEGIPPSPVLVAPMSPTDSFPWATKPSAPKTVGNYWPFATTLYGYVWHSMPQSQPGSLSASEVYQVVAYLLAENGVLARDAILDARTLPAVKLPMRGRLVIDTRRGGAEVR